MPDDQVLFIVEKLDDATSNRERAGIVLRVPDAIMMTYGAVIASACRKGGFEAGWEFCQIRNSLLHATRDEHGLLPRLPAAELEHWRVALSTFAAGGDVAGLSSGDNGNGPADKG